VIINIKYLKLTLVGVIISSGFEDTECNTSAHQWYILKMFLECKVNLAKTSYIKGGDGCQNDHAGGFFDR